MINFSAMMLRSTIALFFTAVFACCSLPVGSNPQQVDLKSLLPETLIAPSGEPISSETLRGKHIGLYFSASWCPPCRSFTPKLIAFRNERATQFEVVLVGSDRSGEEQQAYVTDYGMPWPAIPNNGEHADKLNDLFGIQGIPALIIVSPDGKVVSTQGRDDVVTQGSAAFEVWLAKGS
tara:strand:- start:170 stop:703 length:534 start_codon:yes stop_codon:yes gene_type:complete